MVLKVKHDLGVLILADGSFTDGHKESIIYDRADLVGPRRNIPT